MSDGNRKKQQQPSRETGTVPKVKYWKNSTGLTEGHVSNNLTNLVQQNSERTIKCDSRNRQTCSNHDFYEGSCLDAYKIYPNYNRIPQLNMASSVVNQNTNVQSSSGRQSAGPIRKCDNVTKYPEKRQIEEKLEQIREYVKVTNSLMNNIKDDQSNRESETIELYQMLNALRDSEKKLEHLLTNHVENNEVPDSSVPNQEDFSSSPSNQETPEAQIYNMFQNNALQSNELTDKLLISEKKIQALHEQQNFLMQLQEKAENQMKDARRAQERLAAVTNTFQYVASPVMNGNGQQENMIKIDKNHRSESPDSREIIVNEELLMNGNDGREQMLRLLDARDNELCSEQVALQAKLQDLNSKKQQIDQLVTQLHNYSNDDDDGTDDMAKQIKQIVTMKQQLATLKDMLSMVKSTEADLLRQNSMTSATVEQLQTNLLKAGNNVKDETHSQRAESVTSDRRWGSIGKQSNKSSVSSSRELLQAELQAKKQELEEFMYKDQDRTSSRNRDICNEHGMDKGDHAFSLDSVPSSWTLLQDNTPPRETCVSRENVYSSDEEEIQPYTTHNNIEPPKSLFDLRNCIKPTLSSTSTRPVVNCNPIIHEPSPTPSVSQQWPTNLGSEQKQVELMSSLCQSLLEQQRHNIPNQFPVPNYQWYASYMQTQHSLMLNTISQCCQLLWSQQQEINNLVNNVAMMQQQLQQKQPFPQIKPTVDSVSSACSLPNLSPRAGTSNTQYPMISRVTRPACSTPGINGAPPIPTVIAQNSQPIWGPNVTGNQALNNQVAPGNRANNYWDNFRSYSRQNLLSTSTKSNEGSQNSIPVLERNLGNVGQSTSQIPRSQQSTLSKMNSRTQGRSTQNQNSPHIENMSSYGNTFGNSTIQNNYPQHDTPSQNIGLERQMNQPSKSKRNKGQCRNRNEWNQDLQQPENLSQKSKLFDVLRENIYKEVTLLISANENRPHFLIQLFRDLQLISSDPLRRSTLQSIQNLITQSIGESPIIGHDTSFNSIDSDQLLKIYPPIPEPMKPVDNQQYCQPSNVSNLSDNYKIGSETQHVLVELLPFLKSHNEDIMHNSIVDIIKIMIFQLLPAKHFAADNKLQSKLEMMLNESLMKFQGRRVIEIKEELLKTITDILVEVLQNTTAVKDHPVHENHQKPEDNIPNQLLFLPTNGNHAIPFEFMNIGNVRPVDNGDLAEADQTTQEAENEEGAVGGLLLQNGGDENNVQTNNCDVCF